MYRKILIVSFIGIYWNVGILGILEYREYRFIDIYKRSYQGPPTTEPFYSKMVNIKDLPLEILCNLPLSSKDFCSLRQTCRSLSQLPLCSTDHLVDFGNSLIDKVFSEGQTSLLFKVEQFLLKYWIRIREQCDIHLLTDHPHIIFSIFDRFGLQFNEWDGDDVCDLLLSSIRCGQEYFIDILFNNYDGFRYLHYAKGIYVSLKNNNESIADKIFNYSKPYQMIRWMCQFIGDSVEQDKKTNEKFMKYLFRKINDQKKSKQKKLYSFLLEKICENGDLKLTQLLFEQTKNVRISSSTFHSVRMDENYELLDFLMSNGDQTEMEQMYLESRELYDSD